MKKWSFAALLMVVVLALAACGTSSKEKSGTDSKVETIEVENNFGVEAKDGTKTEVNKTVKVPKNAKKVVVFDMGFLDTLDALGLSKNVVGVPQDSIPSYLEAYKSADYKNVGGLKEPDFEAIDALQPDVIFISGRQASSFEEFNKIAPTVYVGIDTSKYMASFTANTELAGKIFSKEDEATTKLAEIQTKIDDLHKKVTAQNDKALIVLASQGSLSAYGAGSRFGILHDVFGFQQADEKIEVSTHGQTVTSEYVLDKNPDVIFVVDRDSAIGEKSSVKKTLENDLIKKTNAYKNDKIVYLNAETWYLAGGGLESVTSMVDDAAKALK
ncbi:siderophore ABC transporter substrate-binding protein [Kurthia sibirica]|uniref:ABC transporter n=1 Tax=Kurthia sibirica TaxID=202750 RepID=A0A2U3AK76_9BACL|nr:siderophore ABC transporter substrate-binding protein [Kurthia sibirica]PWI24948.1 ABC transporter [Kurthia sibirica]GEK33141.1 putative ABC transporter solute-binding protein YclQ [Kurthia sibirica]